MSKKQRALSTKKYYDQKALDFIGIHDDYRTVSFKNFVAKERDQLQSRLKKSTNNKKKEKNRLSIDSLFELAVNKGGVDNTMRFIFPMNAIQARIYTETLHSDLGCYYSMFGEDSHVTGLECVSRNTYHERLYEKYNLKSEDDFTEFTKRQKIIESLAFISALLRKLDEELQ